MQEMLKPGQWYWVPGGEDRYIAILSGRAELYIVKKKDDFDDSYALVARLKAVRILLAFTCFNNFKLHQMDVKSAFLNGFINEEI